MFASGSLVLYAIADIQIGEEVTIANVQDIYKPLSQLRHKLRTPHGFQCRDCPRCHDSRRSPTPFDYERSKDPGPLQANLIQRLAHLRKVVDAEEAIAKTGGSNGGGSRSLQGCFAQTVVSGLQEWLVMGELAFNRLDWNLYQGRWHLAICYEARQEHAKTVAVLETMASTE